MEIENINDSINLSIYPVAATNILNSFGRIGSIIHIKKIFFVLQDPKIKCIETRVLAF